MNAKVAHYKNLIHRLIALIFGLALIVPSLMQLEHILDGHSHLGCNQNTTHLHELDHGCDLLAFHFSAAALNILEPVLDNAIRIVSQENFWSNAVFKHQKPNTQSSRGPPTLI